ncbi:MAG: zinc ribbon domain-containing protein [Deltaproteobacteria bacterium]|nr:zinc ribbon domain-containing protein [Deltaproteobacteria bacterium]
MAIYEFFCNTCKLRFEQITSSHDPDQGKCPKCHKKKTKKLISKFWVGGRGDLRESTIHGCHDNYTGLDAAEHAHDNHTDTPPEEPGDTD